MSIFAIALLAISLPAVSITNGWCDANFVTVQFGTTNDPPYMVGIYDALCAQFSANSLTRCRPLNYRIVNEKQATLAFPARAVKERTFVQVVPVSWTNEPGFRKMTLDELRGDHKTSFWASRTVIGRGEEDAWLPRPYVCEDQCSQEVPLPVLFKSLSASDGRRIGVDWIGNVVFIVETNAVPNRIYWEGIK